MRRVIRIVGIVTGVIIVLCIVLVGLAWSSGNLRVHLPVKQTERFEHSGMDQFPPLLHVKGNALADDKGDTVRLRGLMPSDPYELEGDKHFDREFFEGMAERGANVIRIPVHPHMWTDNPDYLWRYLGPAVGWAGELGMYVIIDWHSIGNVETGSAPLLPDLYSHTKEMTVDFWTQVARHFRDTPNVLFEVFNEPQAIAAREWHASASELVGLIRSQGASQPVIVGGLEYARELDWVLEMPVDDDNVVYASHIYPAHSKWSWDSYFGDVAQLHPVLITEWGFMEENPSRGQPYLNGTAVGYGQSLMSYLDARGIGWVACWYDDQSEPPMFHPDWESYTRYGEFVMDQLTR